MKILFVDDDLITADWVAIFLKSHGFDIKTAGSVPAAVESLNEWLPDLIISDLSLQGQHAFTLLDYLASTDRTLSIPVVAITGYTLAPSERQRFHGYLKKPVEAGQLLTLIRSLLGGA